MMQCRKCDLHFRFPRLSKQEMDSLYQAGTESNWSNPTSTRNDWLIATALILQMCPETTGATSSVLDIACYNGRFLELLPKRFEKFGVEIQPDAAAEARSRGVDVIASNFEDLNHCDRQFSIVTAFDILEHTHEPLRFIQRAARLVQPGGHLIIGTGNTDALPWRIMGQSYWYSATVEHIAFINRRWCEFAAEQTSMLLIDVKTLSHNRFGIHKVIREWVLNLSFRISPWLVRRAIGGCRTAMGSKKKTSPNYLPPWHSAKDHLLAILRRPS
jgi:SAM-dependent methyltransferase